MFFLCIIPAFIAAAFLLRSGQEDAANLFILLSMMVLAEIFKPEKSTLRTIDWSKRNLKWLCVALILPTVCC